MTDALGWKNGSVALAAISHSEPTSAASSSSKTEQLVHQTDFACHACMSWHAVTSANHSHHLKTLQGYRSGLHSLEPAGRPDHPLERTVIRLDDVVQVLRRPMLDVFRQQSFSLQAPDCPRIGSQFVGRDGGGRTVAHCLQGIAQEAISGVGVTPAGQHGVDQSALFIDRSKQISPASANSYIGLVHSPGA
jgi:hypothetical protein